MIAYVLSHILLGLYRISAPTNPESGHFRKSSQVRLWPNFQPDLPDLADTSAAAVCSVNYRLIN